MRETESATRLDLPLLVTVLKQHIFNSGFCVSIEEGRQRSWFREV